MINGLKIMSPETVRSTEELSLEPTDEPKVRTAGESTDKTIDQLIANGEKEYGTQKLVSQYQLKWNPDPVAYLVVAVSFVLISASLLVYYLENTRNLNLHRDELAREVMRLDELVVSIDSNTPTSESAITTDITPASDGDVLMQVPATEVLESTILEPPAVKISVPSVDAEKVSVQEIDQSSSTLQSSGSVVNVDELHLLIDNQARQIDFLATENHELRLLLEFGTSSKSRDKALPVIEALTSVVIDESVADESPTEKQPVVEVLTEYKISAATDPVNRDTNSVTAASSALNDDPTQTISIYRKLLSEDPHDQLVFAQILQLADAENNLEQELLAHIEHFPESAAALYAVFGNYHSMKQQWSLAWRSYLKSVAKEPTADVLYNLAVSLEHLGRQSEAVQRYQQALANEGNRSFDRQLVKNRLILLRQR